ncbi:YHS domain-containing protein [Nitrosopumilus sp. Nsub]|nr:YHS domain-containing protein [Nitrosopumilus sp. Nsub]
MKDPVCDMDVTEKNDASEYEGKVYHFCCASCKMAFEQNPKQFIKE